ncbi:3'-5' exonuclease [Rhodoblastus acidophilus]|uniref:3'-5' exonuclease n=1 Tax=Candidatus Rhodoblastus alkanivorans TaxID=2954117 RepID=A0ABS9ZBE2_9HYPH|nr:3'-5' exonuclease [Candidatus Rhodoblastus alkanivorans]MCI4679074.1 3'-5' exonuclease [Candidatus Rhodoblastus alkanivorans]MCI4684904.1 3'-5' exonuclease [Candidatus Rhodoblastus alkanivorans]MDI4643190.1 3'-5' exonuclease [Rhodoblastus acidophilus]
MTGEPDLEKFAAALEKSPDYKVLRRLQPRAPIEGFPGVETRAGLFVDVETTGLNPELDEIVELAMVPFRYALDGTVVQVLDPFDRLREPSTPIPPEITALTGITAEMVSGKEIDLAEVVKFAAPAALVIAHNAAFDRRFLERFCPMFSTKPWACSMAEVDWAAEGFEGTKLPYLAMAQGFFYDRHRAANDCLAAIEVLARELPRARVPALAKLLERARQPTWRIWAENSPFECKDFLKARGYRWNGEENGRPRAWYIDVSDVQKDAELVYMQREIYRYEVELNPVRVTAYDRYSDRV